LPLVHAQGIPLCLGWYDGVSPVPPIGDWRFTLVDLRRSSVPGQAPGIALAWGLTDSSAFADTIARGFSGACGWFFLRGTPEVVQKRATPSFGIVLQLIQKLQRDADIAEIEELLKRDVALSYRLLRYINSAGMGLMCEVTSFRHAVQILGYRNLLKWLSLLLLNASQHPSQQALAQTSIVRGRFMEEIGKGFFPPRSRNSCSCAAFFSILDVFARRADGGSPAEHRRERGDTGSAHAEDKENSPLSSNLPVRARAPMRRCCAIMQKN